MRLIIHFLNVVVICESVLTFTSLPSELGSSLSGVVHAQFSQKPSKSEPNGQTPRGKIRSTRNKLQRRSEELDIILIYFTVLNAGSLDA